MKTYYSAQEIEDLARQGVRELVVDDNVVLTDLARQTADLLGVRLAPAGRPAAEAASRPAQAPATVPVAASAPLPARPRGCQHGPMGERQVPVDSRHAVGNGTSGGAAVDDLVGIVRALNKSRS